MPFVSVETYENFSGVFTIYGTVDWKSNQPDSFYRPFRPIQQWLEDKEIEHDNYIPVVIKPELLYQTLNKFFLTSSFQPEWYALKKSYDFLRRHYNFKVEQGSTSEIEALEKVRSMDTSPGMPWRWLHKTKSSMLEQHLKELDLFWNGLEFGMKSFWHLTAKDELLKRSAVLRGKCRQIMGISFELHIAMLRLCTNFERAFLKHKSWSFVGKTKYHLGFDTLARRLLKHPCFVELDGKAFDSNVPTIFQEDVCEWRCETLNHADTRRLKNAYKQCVNSIFVLHDGTVIQKHKGLPSGFTNTLTDDTLHISRKVFYDFIRAFPDKSYEFMMENIEFVFTGDDSTGSISEAVFGRFNSDWMIKTGAELGMTFTSPSSAPMSIHSVTFTGDQFRMVEERWTPVPSSQRTFSAITYSKSGDDLSKQYIRLCAHRLNSWGDVMQRGVLIDIINKFTERYKANLDMVPHLYSNFLTDDEIRQIYYGFGIVPESLWTMNELIS